MGEGYAPSVRAHSATVLGAFYSCAGGNPLPPTRPAAASSSRRSVSPGRSPENRPPRLHRIVVRIRSSAPPRPVQWERLGDRPGARVLMELCGIDPAVGQVDRATTWLGLNSRAPMMADRPIGPAPTTATTSPGRTPPFRTPTSYPTRTIASVSPMTWGFVLPGLFARTVVERSHYPLPPSVDSRITSVAGRDRGRSWPYGIPRRDEGHEPHGRVSRATRWLRGPVCA